MKAMPTIKKHLISSKEHTPVYALENLTMLRMNLPKGNWLGVIERKIDRLRILTTNGEGWISTEDVAEPNQFEFKIFHDSNGMLQYGI
ncbi:hypothetical protein [Portibacter lacus]|nr:hypothetical protein [Portibacter lacus]